MDFKYIIINTIFQKYYINILTEKNFDYQKMK